MWPAGRPPRTLCMMHTRLALLDTPHTPRFRTVSCCGDVVPSPQSRKLGRGHYPAASSGDDDKHRAAGSSPHGTAGANCRAHGQQGQASQRHRASWHAGRAQAYTTCHPCLTWRGPRGVEPGSTSRRCAGHPRSHGGVPFVETRCLPRCRLELGRQADRHACTAALSVLE